MKIGIIVAMGKELALLSPLLADPCEKTLRGRKILEGRIGTHQVALMQCGIGKVNSALSALTMIEEFAPDLVINSGVAGGADASMHVLDLLVATRVAYHDTWCGPGTQYGAAADMDVFLVPDSRLVDLARKLLDRPSTRFGLICSGDKFISTAQEVEQIKTAFPEALAVDMESASIAQVCVQQGVPFNVIRVISDTPGQEENISQYENFWTDAPRETFEALRTLLSSLPA